MPLEPDTKEILKVHSSTNQQTFSNTTIMFILIVLVVPLMALLDWLMPLSPR